MEINGNRLKLGFEGFPVYTKGTFTCMDCGKTFEGGRMCIPGTTTLAAGETRCDECQDKRTKEAQMMIVKAWARDVTSHTLKACGVPLAMCDARFSNFKAGTEKQKLAMMGAAGIAGGYLTAIGFIGDTGRGKTHLCVAIMAAALSEHEDGDGFSMRYLTEARLMEELKGTYDSKSRKRSEADVIEELQAYDLLILDELGKSGSNDVMYNKLQQIVQDRVEDPRKRTVLAGNLSSEGLKRVVGYAVISRLQEVDENGNKKASSYFLDGEDYRSKQK